MPYPSRSRRHADCRHRDEPVELARCRHRAWRRAPAIEEARVRRERLAELAQSLARGSEEGGTQDRTQYPYYPYYPYGENLQVTIQSQPSQDDAMKYQKPDHDLNTIGDL